MAVIITLEDDPKRSNSKIFVAINDYRGVQTVRIFDLDADDYVPDNHDAIIQCIMETIAVENAEADGSIYHKKHGKFFAAQVDVEIEAQVDVEIE